MEDSCLKNLGALPVPSRSSSGYNSNTSEDADGLLPESPAEIGKHLTEECILDPQTLTPAVGMSVLVVERERLVGTSVMEQVIQSEYPIDIVLSCSDGKVGGHRVVLVAASPFLKYVLKDHRLGEVATLILPDISKQVMTLILELCYTGKVVFPPDLVDEINDGLEYLMIGAGAQGDFSLRRVKLVKKEDDGLPVDAESAGTSSQESDPIPVKLEETSNIQRPPVCPSPSHVDSEAETESEGEEEEDEFVDNPNLKHIARAVLAIRPEADGDGDCYHCTTCDLKILSKSTVPTHMKGQHDQELSWKAPTQEELAALSYCPICNVHLPTVFAADECLKKHDLARCYNCMVIIKYEDWASHYKSAHGIKSKHGWVARCRWCDLAIVISKTGHLLRRHARFSHITKVGHPKKMKTVEPVQTVPVTAKPPTKKESKIQIPQSSSSSLNGKTRSRTSVASTKDQAATVNTKNLPQSTTDLAPLLLESHQISKGKGRRSSSRNTAATTEVPLVSGAFFQKFTENIAKRRACRNAVGSKSNTNDSLPPAKKRRLDKDGNPLQLAKRTGKPVGKQKLKFLSPDMKFNKGAFTLNADAATGQISSQQINKLPPVHVHIELLSEQLLTKDSKNEDDKMSQTSLTSKEASVPQSEISIIDDNEIYVTESPSPCKSRITKISDADTQLIQDPFEATKTVRVE